MKPHGFTLLELMITIAIAAILLAIAVPSFQGLINSSRLTGTTNELVAALSQARSEAIRTNARVSICASNNNTACTGLVAGAWPGYIVFTNPNNNALVDAGETVLRTGTISGNTQIKGAAPITFGADGIPNPLNAAITVCLPVTNPAENLRTITLSAGGVRTARSNNAGACP
ncbi:MAG: GspH/FimT family pseudopilin [Halothiobacillaceae bacterium]